MRDNINQTVTNANLNMGMVPVMEGKRRDLIDTVRKCGAAFTCQANGIWVHTATTSYLPKKVGKASVVAIGVASRTAEEQIAVERKMIARRAFIEFLLRHRILWITDQQNASMTGCRFTRDDPVIRPPP